MQEFVFGYGSLAVGAVPRARRVHPDGFLADLRGARRRWGVAMDNRVDRPGYKCYVDAAGRRPALSVCFLDIEPDADPGAQVNGVCLPVDAAQLLALDRRERNYERIDVSERLGMPAGVRAWTFRGSPDGRARFRDAVRDGTAVIHGGYLRAVREAFRSLGECEWRACEPSLHPGGLPVRELVRRELAG